MFWRFEIPEIAFKASGNVDSTILGLGVARGVARGVGFGVCFGVCLGGFRPPFSRLKTAG